MRNRCCRRINVNDRRKQRKSHHVDLNPFQSICASWSYTCGEMIKNPCERYKPLRSLRLRPTTFLSDADTERPRCCHDTQQAVKFNRWHHDLVSCRYFRGNRVDSFCKSAEIWTQWRFISDQCQFDFRVSERKENFICYFHYWFIGRLFSKLRLKLTEVQFKWNKEKGENLSHLRSWNRKLFQWSIGDRTDDSMWALLTSRMNNVVHVFYLMLMLLSTSSYFPD